jgi:hypothetical protein
MKLAMSPEEQCRWMERWRQIAPNVRVNPESESELAEQRVLLQKLRPKSRF